MTEKELMQKVIEKKEVIVGLINSIPPGGMLYFHVDMGGVRWVTAEGLPPKTPWFSCWSDGGGRSRDWSEIEKGMWLDICLPASPWKEAMMKGVGGL